MERVKLVHHAVIVFTAKSIDRLLREGGTSSWRLDRNHARKCTYAAVSYTHLDVYKRQLQMSLSEAKSLFLPA